MSIPLIPALRFGAEYYSLEKIRLTDVRSGGAAAETGLVNAGLIRRDVLQIARAREIAANVPMSEMLAICVRAADLFLRGELPLGAGQPPQSADDYVRQLSSTTGLPHALCRANMKKIHYVLANMHEILSGLTRGLDLSCLDAGIGEHNGVAVSYYALTQALGIVLPSNSPGVNSLWLPAVAAKIPVVIKPGREEPWTPLRIIRAFIAGGCPAEMFCFYPAGHDGADSILSTCGRAIIFGDVSTIERYANNPNIQVHGPGYSKIVLGEDQADNWEKYLDVMVDSVLRNGGRSCVNASAIVTPRNGKKIAEALAQRLAEVRPAPLADANAQLAGFANQAVADYIDHAIEEGLQTPGAIDCTARLRNGPRKVDLDGCRYLLPTVIYCEDAEHPLANREFLFPFCSVREIPQAELLEKIGPTLVCSAITTDENFSGQLLQSPLVERLNIGAISTMELDWAQPHEGNMFEFLYRRRAIQQTKPGVAAAAKRNGVHTVNNALLSKSSFIHHARTRILFGCGMLEQLGRQAAEIGAKCALIVSDSGIVAAGHVGRATQLLRDAGIGVQVFDRVVENPTTNEIEQCVEFARSVRADLLIGLGGGSSMDTAKGCNFILTNGGTMRDYQGYGKATRPMLPLIAIPTTAGTGSECQSYALISDPQTHQKMACGDPRASAAVAILDPLLTLTQPAFVTACTGIDALAHALETAVTKRRNPYSLLFSREAFRLLIDGFPRVVREPDDLEARSRMLLGAAYAGIAIEHSMLGAAHSAANPLTAHFGVVHGQAVGLMLPHVIRFNAEAEEIGGIYLDLLNTAKTGERPAAAPDRSSNTPAAILDAAGELTERLREFLRSAGFPVSLREVTGSTPDFELLAREAAGQWTAQFNPREITAENFLQIYRQAFV